MIDTACPVLSVYINNAILVLQFRIKMRVHTASICSVVSYFDQRACTSSIRLKLLLRAEVLLPKELSAVAVSITADRTTVHS